MLDMKALAILVPFIGGILVVYIAHFLSKSREQEKTRIDEVKKNLEQLQAYFNHYFDAGNLIMDLETKVLTMNTIDDCPAVLDRIHELVNEARKKFKYMRLVKDSEIIRMEKEWVETILIEHRKLLDLIGTIEKKLPINNQIELSRVYLFNKSIASLYQKITARLDELAQKVP